ncbi:MAG: HTH-type transcriptional regulator YesS [Verrucomicrobia subdivision 3 bacterium]|nr:HTH-type transcriptional regulator YesS [Limisphaerales bacterium]MCS1412466.1 HTH-type transcriptional regulator YesS [Limisphaerales bacterium]
MKATSAITLTVNLNGKHRRSTTPSVPPSRPSSETERDKQLIKILAHSATFQEFAESFSTVTGLPLTLCPAVCWDLPLHNHRNEGAFCRAAENGKNGCATCFQRQEDTILTRECPFGLIDSALPIKVEGRTIAHLQTGQVMIKPIRPECFEQAAKTLEARGITLDASRLQEAYLQTRYIAPEKYQSMVRLLRFMAEHLSATCNQLAIQQNNAEPVLITRARKYINDNITEELSLSQVATAVNASSFYFCKMFKRVTGLNFTNYVSRVRVEKAKELLHNPNLRISEIAFDVGFQSLTHFNRVFRKITGVSPTDYRRS